MIELTWMVMVELGILCLILETVDSALGQLYGTAGSPILVLLGFDAKLVIPAVLISQACGGLAGIYWHHRYGNVDVSTVKTEDAKKSIFIIMFASIGVIIGAIIVFKIPKDIISAYIGTMVLAMGILMLCGITLKFTWKKLAVIGVIAAANKVSSSGGWGPILVAGNCITGTKGKNSVGITDIAEAPVCIVGFIIWCVAMNSIPPLMFIAPMCIGAAIAPVIGARITKSLHDTKQLEKILATVIVILGVLCLMKFLNP